MKARVVRFEKAGPPEVMRLVSMDLPQVQAGEVLVRQTAIGVNYADVYIRSGFYPGPVPSGVGTEAAGVVEQVGTGVTLVKAGDRVCYQGGASGAYADVRILPADRLLKIPEGISDEQAAASTLKGQTVEYLLNRCYPVRSGEFVLMHAAAGGIGLVAGQWGKSLGARMIGVAGGPDKCRLAAANGYEFVIDRTTEDIVERVKAITGGAMVPVVYDSIGKATFDVSLACLGPRGFFVSFGTTTGAPPPIEAATLQKKGSLYLTRPTLVTYTAKRADYEASGNAVFGMLAKGALKLSINQRYRLDECVRAHAELEGGRTTGSSILLP
jgi:NADPH2:quinone reductase